MRIKAQVENGITDINSISENTGISKNRVRTIARRKGINVPRELLSYEQDLEQLSKETDDEKLQELLDQLPYHVIKRRKKKENSQFSSLFPLIREGGFRSRNNHPFAASLKSAEVPVPITIKEIIVKGVRQTYYIVLSRDSHKDRIIKAFREDQELQRFQR